MNSVWDSAFGTIERGKKYTVFSLSVRLKNGLRISQTLHAANNELEDFDDLYAYILNKLVCRLDERIAERA